MNGARQAGEAALLVLTTVETSGLTSESLARAARMVYGDRISSGEVGTVLAELLLSHALAVERVAELGGTTRHEAAASLVRIMEGNPQ